MTDYHSILDTNEKILWQGKPQVGLFFLKTLATVPVGLFLLYLSTFVMTAFFPTFHSNQLYSQNVLAPQSTFFMFFPLIILLPFFGFTILFLFNPLLQMMLYRHLLYLITDKRIIIQSGLIGVDFKIIDFDQIHSIDIKVGLLDKLFGHNSGSVYIDAGQMVVAAHGIAPAFTCFYSISNPYKIGSVLKQGVFDIKTDISYPNAYRPPSNQGYETEYQRQSSDK